MAAERASVVIVGAGPAGAATAIRLGKLGIPGVVLVDSCAFPRDKTCGSGVSPKGIAVLRELDVWDKVQPHAYPIRGLRLVTPAGHDVSLSGGESAAAIVCARSTFDEVLVRHAETLGVRFVPRFTARGLIQDASGRTVGVSASDGRELLADFTVVANGTHSQLTPIGSPKNLLQAVMGWWEGVPFEAHRLEMIYDRALLPHYGWLFPEGGDRVNIGICYEDGRHANARSVFASFLERHFRSRLAGARPIGRLRGQAISYSYSIGSLTSPGRVSVGEAARLTHPATAEGIYQGMRSGIFAAEAIAKAMGGDEAKAFAAFERRCRKAFLASFWCSKAWSAAVRGGLLDGVVGLTQRPAVSTTLGRVMARM